MWQLLEPLHATVYFAPEVQERYRSAGLRGFWMGYFASRAHPLGPVPAEVVTATFFGFAPCMVARAIPDAWQYSSVEAIGAARRSGVDEALRRLLGDHVDSPELAEAVELAERAAMACGCDGRPLYAAHRALDRPGPAHLRLWHAATLLREHRGDGHVAANVAAGVDGLAAHVMFVGTGAVPRTTLQPNRGWTDDAWRETVERLQRRGWLDGDRLTPEGAAVRAEIEDRTDASAEEPWELLGHEAADRLAALLAPIAATIVAAGAVPFPNPMGVPRSA